MAKLTLSVEELVQVAISNGLLPSEIARVRVKGERIHFVIRTGAFILPFIPASLQYQSFDGDKAIFKLTVVSSHANKAVGWLNERIKLEMPDHTQLEYPNVSVEINRLIEKKNLRGVKVKEISFRDGEFSIITGDS
ncbi:MAG: hypothetical protein ACYSTZ_12885 [Planctomycetota bacterium]|jgi:hypothetical protein